ncbi:Crp/Fnr family transcriptional regulator [Halolactibacillus miurensis]|uniref:Crp/Fnr family transcriptional regulator n=1 Tax=Halolactibacillus miurensis TaxID=306541 RepID=A0A1I6PAX7_9BACI|nr:MULTISPECIES: Crp/Fnr family transcriptional regulator [Halolactibacillus]GEM05912.1 Crp/Fnr family transcriptional regulator [Halolactibacillus miurensis]SFS37321.1 CRP/FNR family transcriptional regulator, anaerobic regulatory protein [Halolactibacillus miurensis]
MSERHHMTGCVRRVPIFNHLPEEQLNEVMKTVHSKPFLAGSFLFKAGDKSTGLYVVHTGKVKLYRSNEEGKDQLVRLLLPGDFTGELGLFLDQDHDVFAQAVEDSQVCHIKQSDIETLLTAYPKIALTLLKHLAKRLDESERALQQATSGPVDVRLKTFIHQLVPGAHYPIECELPMKQKDLASHLGTTPESISRAIKRLEKSGEIKKLGPKSFRILKPLQ